MAAMPPQPYAARNRELVDEALALVDLAAAADVEARVLGGLGILLHDADLLARGGSRPINDIDLIVPGGRHRVIADVLVARGYVPEERFNALNGHRRLVFHGPLADLDVLVGIFEMCHRIDMGPRLGLDRPTLPVTDLLVTKLQIVKLNEKDLLDIVDLVAGHELGRGAGDWIDVDRLEELVHDDWGLWRTVTGTIDTVRAAGLPGTVVERLSAVRAALDASSKSRRWRMRARVGERMSWYVLPDEVNQ
jgi:hypothetical protein